VLPRAAEPTLPDPAASLFEVAGQLGLPPPTWQHLTGEHLQSWAITFRRPGAAA
jgi:hypothetical protein